MKILENIQVSAEQRLKDLGIELPPPMSPAGAYRPVVIANGMAHVSGQGPVYPDRTMITGKVPSQRSVEEGVEAARLTALNSLAILRDQLGSLDRIEEAQERLDDISAEVERRLDEADAGATEEPGPPRP